MMTTPSRPFPSQSLSSSIRLISLLAVCLLVSSCSGSFLKDFGKTSDTQDSSSTNEKQKVSTASYSKQAKDAEMQGDYIAAAAFWGSLSENNPDNIAYAVAHARCARKAGLMDKAMEVLNTTYAKAPNDATLNTEMGYALLSIGNADRAASAFKIASDANPRDTKLLSALGVSYDRAGDYQKAMPLYEKALSLDPQNTLILNNYALSRMAAGDPQKAKHLASQALERPDLTATMRAGLMNLVSPSSVNLKNTAPVPLSSNTIGTNGGSSFETTGPTSLFPVRHGKRPAPKASSEALSKAEAEATRQTDELVNGVDTLLSQPKRWGS